MKQCNKFLALVLAVIMILSNANLGLTLAVSAAETEYEHSVTLGTLLEQNYGISAEESDFIDKYLVSETYGYNVPNNDADDMIVIGDGTVEVKNFENWTISEVRLVPADGSETEIITLTDGKGTYAYDGNAFSIEVDYDLYQNVDVATQKLLLSAIDELKRAQAEIATSANADVDAALETVAAALPTLKDMADNGIPVAAGVRVPMVNSTTADAIDVLFNQLAEGKLDLQVENSIIGNVNALEYLSVGGVEYQALVETTRTALETIKNDTILTSNDILEMVKTADFDSYLQVVAFMGIVGDLVADLETVANATPWNFDAVAEGVDYTALSAALAHVTASEIVDPIEADLAVGGITLNKGRSMWNVNITVKVNTLKNNELVEVFNKTGVVTLIDGTVKADAKVAVDAKVAEILGSFDLTNYVLATETVLPDTLSADTTYTATYEPKQYTVELDYADELVVYHGHVYTLPVNANEGKEYDYFVNGVQYLEGSVITITADTVITRTEMPAYTHYDLYSVIADNFGNAVAKEILKSGVLLGSEDIRVQIPSIDSVELELKDDVLSVLAGEIAFDAHYNGLTWDLYFGAKGNENKFTADEASWNEPMVNYSYILKLDHVSAADVQAVMDLVTALKAEAKDQMTALNKLYGYYDDMAQLDSITISALKGIIDGTTFTDANGVAVSAEMNAELQKHFKDSLTAIGPNCQDLVAAMGSKNDKNLRHFYANSAEMIAAVALLSENLDAMLPSDEYQIYLSSLFDSLAGTNFEDYIQYKEKIQNLKSSMAEVKADLKAPNAKINLEHAKVGELADLLQSNPNIQFQTAAVPSISSAVKMVMDSSYVNIMITINVDGETKTVTLPTAILEGTVLDPAVVADMQAQIDEFLAENLKCAVDFYTVEGSYDLASKAGQPLEETYEASVTYTIKHYNVTLNGENKWEITAARPVIDLPKAAPGYKYLFKVNGVDYEGSSYTFSADEIRTGALDVTYVEIDVKTGEFEDAFLNSDIFTPVANPDTDSKDKYIGLNATLDPSKSGLLGFATALQEAGYDYIYLNNEPLLVAGDGLQLHVQTLINALLADPSFGSDKLIELGLGNAGARSADNNLLNATIQLFKTNPETGVVEQLWDLEFNLFLESVPNTLVDVAKALEAVDPFFWFKSKDGQMEVHLNLPEKIYEMYLSALVVSGYQTNDNLTETNFKIAYAYLCDAIEVFADSSINVDSFQNTLTRLHIDRDITKFAPYYNKLKALFANGLVEVKNNESNVGVDVNAKGAHIDTLLNLLGVDLNTMTAGAVKIVEIQNNSPVVLNSIVSVDNTAAEYEAVIIDANAIKSGVKELTDGVTRGDLLTLIKGQGLANGIDFTENLIDRLNGVGASAIMLLGDINGDLVFNGTTILDLNGNTVNGNIVSNGRLIIIDSNLAADYCGTVTGTVSGDASIIAGKFPNQNVTAFLPDGYKVENGYVHNAMYTVEGDLENLNFVINTDFMHEESINGYLPSVRAMAADIVADVVLNQYLFASLSANGHVIHDFGVDRILEVLEDSETTEILINELLECFRLDGASAFMNEIVAQLLDFGAIAEAMKNEEPVVGYTLTTCPWTVKLHSVDGGESLDLGFVPNTVAARDLNLSLTFAGENRMKLVKVFEHLDVYVDASAELNLKQPVYDDRTLYLAGDGFMEVDVDLTVNKTWQTVIAVILAYGNPDKADALVNAIGDEWALRKIFNSMTVEEVFTATKVMNRDTTFAEMAESLGVTLDAPGREQLEELYHTALCAFGKVLEKLDITGYTNKTMGMLEVGKTGTYELAVNTHKHADVSYRGFTLDVDGVLNTTGISVSIFDLVLPEAEWSASAQLGNTLALRLYFYVPELEDITGHYVTLTRTYANGDGEDEITIPASEWGTLVEDGKTYHYFEYNGLAAKEMIDDITAQVYDADGDPIIHSYTESIRSYAMRMLKKHDVKNDSSTLFVDLLNYGAEAQVYFGYATQDLANSQLTDAQKAFGTQDNIVCADTSVPGVNYDSSALQLKSSIKFGFFFTNVDDAAKAVVSFTNHRGVDFEYETEILDTTDAKYVVVDEIRAADCDTEITVVIYNAEGEVIGQVTDSMRSYIARMQAGPDIYNAIMKYAVSAYNYFH